MRPPSVRTNIATSGDAHRAVAAFAEEHPYMRPEQITVEEQHRRWGQEILDALDRSALAVPGSSERCRPARDEDTRARAGRTAWPTRSTGSSRRHRFVTTRPARQRRHVGAMPNPKIPAPSGGHFLGGPWAIAGRRCYQECGSERTWAASPRWGRRNPDSSMRRRV